MMFREDVLWDDLESVRHIVTSSGFFSEAEIVVALELIEERLTKGIRSGYYFLFAEKDERVAGYACFGPIPCTLARYDLHWIAVHKSSQGEGIGTELLKRSEAIVTARGGKRIYIETASRKQYKPTRRFYLHCGYREEAVLDDFYAPGDNKVIYMKLLKEEE